MQKQGRKFHFLSHIIVIISIIREEISIFSILTIYYDFCKETNS